MALLRKRSGEIETGVVAADGSSAGAIGRIGRAPTAQPPQPVRADSKLIKRSPRSNPASAPATPDASAQTRFGYPAKIALTLRLVAYLLIALALFNLGRTILAVIATPGFDGADAVPLIGAIFTVAFTLAAAAFIAAMLPSFDVRAEGLAISSLFGWRVLPWERVGRLHTMELQNERYLVFLEYAGRSISFTHRVYPLFAGVGGKNGVFYTSDVRGFEDLTRLILAGRMRAVPGVRVEDLLDETANMPLFSIIAFPERAMNRLAGVAEEDAEGSMIAVAELHTASRGPAIRAQVALAAVPLGLFFVDRLTRGQIPPFTDLAPFLWAVVGLMLLGVAELFIVALASQALGENLVGRGEFNLPMAVYPYLQMVRILTLTIAFALVAVRAPFVITLTLWVGGAILVSYLAALFVQRLYSVHMKQSFLVGGASVVMQSLVIILYMIVRG